MIKIVCSIIPGNRNWCSLYLTCYIDRATLGFTLVVISRGEMSEFLPAMFTTIRLLSCMNASMSCELMLLGKLPSTIRTLKIKKKEWKGQNLYWKLGQQTLSVGTLLAYLETTKRVPTDGALLSQGFGKDVQSQTLRTKNVLYLLWHHGWRKFQPGLFNHLGLKYSAPPATA